MTLSQVAGTLGDPGRQRSPQSQWRRLQADGVGAVGVSHFSHFLPPLLAVSKSRGRDRLVLSASGVLVAPHHVLTGAGSAGRPVGHDAVSPQGPRGRGRPSRPQPCSFGAGRRSLGGCRCARLPSPTPTSLMTGPELQRSEGFRGPCAQCRGPGARSSLVSPGRGLQARGSAEMGACSFPWSILSAFARIF